MEKIIELEQDSDGVYKPKNIVKSEKREVYKPKRMQRDPVTQLLDGFERGMKLVDRAVRLIYYESK